MAIMYNFQMDYTYNITSIEQISFKLTENYIPSINQLPHSSPRCDSLDYTHSRVSIHFKIEENQEQNMFKSTPERSCLQKQSILKTMSTDLSAITPSEKNTKASFRQRRVSNNKQNSCQKIKRRFSLHVMCLGAPNTQIKDSKTPLHTPKSASFRYKQQKKKRILGKNLFSSKKIMEQQLIQLKNSIKVKGIVLESHQGREKSFMKKVIQNRSNVIHLIQQLSRAPKMWTSRKIL